ncbi:MAG TPA: PBP1A family penicillin-binding protein [Candidatus Limnocylindrales bacterium]|nr:PBP1A family penicillin-binding protein [Candidatus Limnocylindrales bacterium]
MRMLKWMVAVMLSLVCAVGGVIVLATYDEMTSALPPIERLLQYEPPVATRVFASDGALVEEFYRERRYLVPIEKIPPVVRNAFLASEDADFYSHSGVDFIGIARAFAANLSAGSVVQGGSTITQQVVKVLLLTPERSYERKMKEILLALRLEQHLSKDQILELYLNQIYFGEGNHGVGAAARSYFDKQVSELTPAQAALLAGLPAAPSRYSPRRNPEAAMKRQRYVLRRMVEENFLSAGDYQNALREELTLAPQADQRQSVRNYYTEAVRLQLEEMFGEDAPYNQGYTVHTAMDPRLQGLAEAAVRNGIERVDTALGYRGPLEHLDATSMQSRIDRDATDPSLATLDRERIYQGVVTSASSGSIEVVVGPHRGKVDTSSVSWSSKVKSRSFKVGDVVEVRTRKPGESAPRQFINLDEDGDGEADKEPPAQQPASADKLYLAQTPEIEAALVAIDMKDGGVAAMVGGYDFLRTQFNRALQAKRQPGSAFKPFVYAAGLDHGYTPASMLRDSPVEYMDNGKPWQPRNYTRDYRGPISFRQALEQSRNVVSVKLVDAVGVDTVVDYLERFHFDAELGANLSIALGTSEMSLLDLTAGYTAFAGGGVKVEPVIVKKVEDKAGTVFFQAQARRREVLSPQTAALMTYILEGVVQRGTATTIKALGRPVAGKTGTTNDQRDAWFVGYTPDLVVGVWVGFDDQTRSMGKMGTGGRVAAPVWLEFMKAALQSRPVRDFELPDGIRCVNIDAGSGTRASEATTDAFLECFKEGTEPIEPPTVWANERREPRRPILAEPGEDGATEDTFPDTQPDDGFREEVEAAENDPYRVPLESEDDGVYRIPDEAEAEPDPRYQRPAGPVYDSRFRVPAQGSSPRPPDRYIPPPPPAPPPDRHAAPPPERYVPPPDRDAPPDRYPAPGRYSAPPAARYSAPPRAERHSAPPDGDRYLAPADREPPPADRAGPPPVARYSAPPPSRYAPSRLPLPPPDPPRTMSEDDFERVEPRPHAERYERPSREPGAPPADASGRPSPQERDDPFEPREESVEEPVRRGPRIIDRYGEQRDEARDEDDFVDLRTGEPVPAPRPPDRPPVSPPTHRTPPPPSARAPGPPPDFQPPSSSYRPPSPSRPAVPTPSRPIIEERYMAPRHPTPQERQRMLTAPMAEEDLQRRPPDDLPSGGPSPTLPEQRPPKPTAPPPGARVRPPGTVAPPPSPPDQESARRAEPGFIPYPTRPPPPRPPDVPMQ